MARRTLSNNRWFSLVWLLYIHLHIYCIYVYIYIENTWGPKQAHGGHFEFFTFWINKLLSFCGSQPAAKSKGGADPDATDPRKLCCFRLLLYYIVCVVCVHAAQSCLLLLACLLACFLACLLCLVDAIMVLSIHFGFLFAARIQQAGYRC